MLKPSISANFSFWYEIKTVNARKIVGTHCTTQKYVIDFVDFSSSTNFSSIADAISDRITMPISTADDNFLVSDLRYFIKSFCMFLSLILKVNFETYKFLNG